MHTRTKPDTTAEPLNRFSRLLSQKSISSSYFFPNFPKVWVGARTNKGIANHRFKP